MYRLYWCPRTASQAPMAVLEEIGADYELKLVDAKAGQHRSPEYLRINPNGLIPMLATPDGATLFESAAILVFFLRSASRSEPRAAAGRSAAAGLSAMDGLHGGNDLHGLQSFPLPAPVLDGRDRRRQHRSPCGRASARCVGGPRRGPGRKRMDTRRPVQRLRHLLADVRKLVPRPGRSPFAFHQRRPRRKGHDSAPCGRPGHRTTRAIGLRAGVAGQCISVVR